MAKMTDAEFVAAWYEAKGSPAEMSRMTGMAERRIYARRNSLIEAGIPLQSVPNTGRKPIVTPVSISPRQTYSLNDGVVIVFSDAHYYPGDDSAAHRALIKLIKELKPKMVIANGDILDGASISKHERIGWESRPTLAQELEVVQQKMSEIEDAVPKGCILHRTIGNHDIRFEKKLSGNVPQYEGIAGTRLKDHLPAWTESWSLYINPDYEAPTMVKHRPPSQGLHSSYNSTLRAGTNMVCGHLHKLMVYPWTDYRGRRYGVDTGTLSDWQESSAFNYAEDDPRPWASGFAVLTFHKQHLLLPELCQVADVGPVFRGQVLEL